MLSGAPPPAAGGPRPPEAPSGGETLLEVWVRTSNGARYPVRIGPGVLADLPRLLREHVGAFRHALVGDRTVLDLHGERVESLLGEAGIRCDRFDFPPGEAHKSRAEWARLTDLLLDAGIGRDGCLLALGGGVSGDLAGFVAATFMRGIPVVQLPTSLVAMVDSSVGGKTGIDVPSGKNLVGAFHPPRFVLADTRLARTLPRSERSQGLAEAIKHGAIVDAGYFDRLRAEAAALLAGDDDATARAVGRSVEIKADIVTRDERERGMREVLNFGHTIGHALEAASDFRLSHGSAVAIGMVLEARLGERLGITAPGTAERLREGVRAMELPWTPPSGLEPDLVVRHMLRDKKARRGEPRVVLLDRLGAIRAENDGCSWSRPVRCSDVRAVLAEAGDRPG